MCASGKRRFSRSNTFKEGEEHTGSRWCDETTSAVKWEKWESAVWQSLGTERGRHEYRLGGFIFKPVQNQTLNSTSIKHPWPLGNIHPVQQPIQTLRKSRASCMHFLNAKLQPREGAFVLIVELPA